MTDLESKYKGVGKRLTTPEARKENGLGKKQVIKSLNKMNGLNGDYPLLTANSKYLRLKFL